MLPELRTIQLEHKVLMRHHPLEIDPKERALLDKHMIRAFFMIRLTRFRGRVFPLIALGQLTQLVLLQWSLWEQVGPGR